MTAVFLFPGQGAQAVGMCSSMMRTFPLVARRVAQGSELLATDLSALISTGPPRALAQTDVAQVAIYCLGFALYELLLERGFRPALLAGHSLGQFTALAASGVLDFDQGLALVAARGAAMHAVNQGVDGAMLAVQGQDVQGRLAALTDEPRGWWIANRNAPGQVVLAGLRPCLQALRARLRDAGMVSTWLDVAGPYHSPLMQPAAAAFRPAIDACTLADAGIPLVANSTATVIVKREPIDAELRAHMLSPVDWAGTMREIAAHSPSLLVEVGPGRVLKGLALRNLPRFRCMTTGATTEFDAACAALQETTCAS